MYGSRYNFNVIKALEGEKEFLDFWRGCMKKVESLRAEGVSEEEIDLLLDWAACIKRVFTDVEVARDKDLDPNNPENEKEMNLLSRVLEEQLENEDLGTDNPGPTEDEISLRKILEPGWRPRPQNESDSDANGED